MKKTLIALIITSIFVAPTVTANEFKGWRIGGGYISNNSKIELEEHDETSTKTGSMEAEGGFYLEGGYEFNKIVGVKFSANKTGFTGEEITSSERELHDIDTISANFSTDVGYTFQVGNFDIKPYGELGYSFSSSDITETNYENSGDSDSDSYDNAKTHGGFYGIGIRTTYNKDFYTDLTIIKSQEVYDVGSIHFDDGTSSSDANIQARFSLGYKF